MYTEIATLLRMERTGLLTYERYTLQVIHNSIMLNSASNTYPLNRTVHMERSRVTYYGNNAILCSITYLRAVHNDYNT